MLPEVERLLTKTKPTISELPKLDFYGSLVKSSKSEYGSSLDPIKEEVQYLRQTIVSNREVLLVPLQLAGTGLDDIAHVFYRAWQYEPNRKWYLQTLPRTYKDTLKVLENWDNNPNSLIYVTQNESMANWDCYLSFSFSKDTDDNDKTQLWLAYGLLHHENSGQGFTKKSARLAMDHLASASSNMIKPISKCLTTVNMQNIPSIEILKYLGLQYDTDKVITDSPAVAGGKSIPMVKYFK